jgi:tRNA(Ile)-lysidine synthase
LLRLSKILWPNLDHGRVALPIRNTRPNQRRIETMDRGVYPRLKHAIAQAKLIVSGDRVGVAVSGGADSVALLRLLDDLRAQLGIILLVVHFDHKLRKESADDARFVEQLAKRLGLKFIAGAADVAAEAARNKWNLEDAGRRLRYAFFEDVVKRGEANRIAVAQTMDDQAETVLARVLRGSGPSGLAGILATNGAVVRPLLAVRRADLRQYLRSIGQQWREDATNRDTTRQRARIREKLLPLLENEFSASATEQLRKLARLSAEEAAFWNALVDDRYRALATGDGKTVSISIARLLSPLALRPLQGDASGEPQRSLTERLIRRLYQSAGSCAGLSSAHVERVILLAATGASGKKIELPGGVLVTRNFGEMVFSPRATARSRGVETGPPANAYQYLVHLNETQATEVTVPELATCFRLKVIDWASPERETIMWRGILDFDRLRQPLVLRNWRPGDNYRPRGRRKTRKLKDMFLAARIAADRRRQWPVLESDGRVIWAKGMDPAEDVCAAEKTRAGVLIEERKL